MCYLVERREIGNSGTLCFIGYSRMTDNGLDDLGNLGILGYLDILSKLGILGDLGILDDLVDQVG